MGGPQDFSYPQGPHDSPRWQDPPDSPYSHDADEDQPHDGFGERRPDQAAPLDWQDARWQDPADGSNWTDPRHSGYQYPQDPVPGAQPSAARYLMWRSRKYLRIAGVLIAICVGIGGFALGHFGRPAKHPPGQVTVDQYRTGLCIAGPGSVLNLGTNSPWPQFTTQVSCSKPHVAEVVYAGNYWGSGTTFPADQVRSGASAACAKEFRGYVGTPVSSSVLNVDPIVPDAASWSHGSKGLECVAWHSTTSHPDGAPLTQSVRDSRH